MNEKSCVAPAHHTPGRLTFLEHAASRGRLQTAQSGRAPGARLSNDVHWTHHLVVLMFKDVTMPHELVAVARNYLRARGQIKLHDQLGHSAREGLHHVFGSV